MLDPEMAASHSADVLETFQGRHRDLLATFEARADEMEDAFAPHSGFSKVQRQLVGAYFLHEYSFEASALFNPSIVSHPDQSGAPEGGRRFILSLRAVGEGHVSSLTFRSGCIAADEQRGCRSDGASCYDCHGEERTTSADGEDLEVIVRPDKDVGERMEFPVTLSQSETASKIRASSIRR